MNNDEVVKKSIGQEIAKATVNILVDGQPKGTGFFITPDGYVLTAYHCIGAWPPEIRVKTASGEHFIARLDEEKTSVSHDIAVLKVDACPSLCLPLGGVSSQQVSDEVISLGYPGSDRLDNQQLGFYPGKIFRLRDDGKIETDAVRGGGQSGGPLYHYNTKRVVGVVVEHYWSKEVQQLAENKLVTAPPKVLAGLAVQLEPLFARWSELESITGQVAKEWDKRLEQLGVNIYHHPEINFPDLKSFRGRTEQIKELVEKLNDSAKTPVVVKGMGGVGKSFLVYYVIDKLIREGYYPDGQIYINLRASDLQISSVNEVEESQKRVLAKLIQAFYPNETVQGKDKETLYRRWREIIKSKNILLFMDNADAEGIEELVDPESPLFMDDCQVVITSRRVLHLSFPIHQIFLDPMNEAEAISFLMEIANFPQKNRLTNVQAKRLAELCGHLPLALHIAANTLNKDVTWNSEGYLRELATERQRLKQLKLKGRVTRLEQPSRVDVEASLNLSLITLADDLANLWKKLGLFVGLFDAFDICSTAPSNQPPSKEILLQCEEELDGYNGKLHELAERSLVQFFPKTELSPSEQEDEIKRRRNRNRYRLHELLRELALLKQAPQEELTLKRLYANYYFTVLAEAERRYHQEGQIEGLKYLDYKLPNIREGQAWVAKHFRSDDLSIARLTMRYAYVAPECLKLRLATAELIKWLEIGLEAAKYLDPLLSTEPGEFAVFRREQASLLNNLGTVYDTCQQFDQVISYYEKSLRISREIQFEELETMCLYNLGAARQNLGQSVSAIWYYKKALKRIRNKSVDRTAEGICLANLAIAYKEVGEIDRAFEYVDKALKIAHDTENFQAKGERFCIRGNLYVVRGEYDLAMEDYQRALKIFQDTGDLWNKGILLDSMARTCIDKEDYPQAIKYAVEGIEVAKQMDNPRINNECYSALALAYLLSGDLSTARIAIEEARKYNHPTNNLQVTFLRGIIALGQKDYTLAEHAFGEAFEQGKILIDRNSRNYEARAFKELSLCGLKWCKDGSSDCDTVYQMIDETQPAKGLVKRTQCLLKKLGDFSCS